MNLLTSGYESADDLVGQELDDYQRLVGQRDYTRTLMDDVNKVINEEDSLLESARVAHRQRVAEGAQGRVLQQNAEETKRAWQEAKEIAPKITRKAKDTIVDSGRKATYSS